ncbi:MAG: hypothetical protein ABI675_25720 [Chitinophagaceae bacterium]
MEIDWQDIYVKLKAFSCSWAGSKSWFRGEGTTSFYQGKEGHDYAMDAILKHIERPEKYNPELGDLLKYLNYSFVRMAVGNDVRRQENKLTKDIFGDDHDESEDGVPYAERLLPYTEAAFTDDYDYEELKKYIEERVKDDSEAEKIYMGKILEMARDEIIKDSGMTPDQYNNAFRRLKTIANKALAYLKATKPHGQQKKSKQV